MKVCTKKLIFIFSAFFGVASQAVAADYIDLEPAVRTELFQLNKGKGSDQFLNTEIGTQWFVMCNVADQGECGPRIDVRSNDPASQDPKSIAAYIQNAVDRRGDGGLLVERNGDPVSLKHARWTVLLNLNERLRKWNPNWKKSE